MDQAIWTNHDGNLILRLNGCEILVSRPELESLLHRIPIALQCGESLDPDYESLRSTFPPKAERVQRKPQFSLEQILEF